jgi:hypothetical protein
MNVRLPAVPRQSHPKTDGLICLLSEPTIDAPILQGSLAVAFWAVSSIRGERDSRASRKRRRSNRPAPARLVLCHPGFFFLSLGATIPTAVLVASYGISDIHCLRGARRHAFAWAIVLRAVSGRVRTGRRDGRPLAGVSCPARHGERKKAGQSDSRSSPAVVGCPVRKGGASSPNRAGGVAREHCVAGSTLSNPNWPVCFESPGRFRVARRPLGVLRGVRTAGSPAVPAVAIGREAP